MTTHVSDLANNFPYKYEYKYIFISDLRIQNCLYAQDLYSGSEL